MPLNQYQQEVGPSLVDATPGKVPDLSLIHIYDFLSKNAKKIML